MFRQQKASLMILLKDRAKASGCVGNKPLIDAASISTGFRWALQGGWISIILLLSGPVAADTSDQCLIAARTASVRTGVPLAVLIAVAQTETGRTHAGGTQPWPWSVNIAGKGHYFNNATSALSFVRLAHENGERNIDIGCFQINFRWHGHNFSSFEEMLDPTENAVYAAGFLSRLHDEKGDWSLAAGAYHSRTQEHALRYRAKFDRFLAAAFPVGSVKGATPGPMVAIPNAHKGPRLNTFPLLQPGLGNLTMGSLVPMATGS